MDEPSCTDALAIPFSRRGFFSLAAIVGGLTFLGGSRYGNTLVLAYADEANALHFKIYVMNREEIPVLALDYGNAGKPLDSVSITLASQVNSNSVTKTTDETGFAIFNIRALSEDANASLDSYSAWVKVDATKSGYMSFTETSRLVTSGVPTGTDGSVANLVQIPTSAVKNGYPYLRCLCMDGVDVQCLNQTARITAKNDFEHFLEIEVENATAGSSWTAALSIKGATSPLATATGTANNDGSVSMELTGTWLDGASGHPQVGDTLELTLTQTAGKATAVLTVSPRITFAEADMFLENGYDDGHIILLGTEGSGIRTTAERKSKKSFTPLPDWLVNKGDSMNIEVPFLPVKIFSDAWGNFGAVMVLGSVGIFKARNFKKVPIDPNKQWKLLTDTSGSNWVRAFKERVTDACENLANALPEDNLHCGATPLTSTFDITMTEEFLLIGTASGTLPDKKWEAIAYLAAALNVNFELVQHVVLWGIPLNWGFDFNVKATCRTGAGIVLSKGLDSATWQKKFNTHVVFMLLMEAGLSIGVGLRHVLAAGIRGSAWMLHKMDFAKEAKKFPDYRCEIGSRIEAFVELLIFRKTFKLKNLGQRTLYPKNSSSLSDGAYLTLADGSRFGDATLELTDNAISEDDFELITEQTLSENCLEFESSLSANALVADYGFVGTQGEEPEGEPGFINPYDAAATSGAAGANATGRLYDPIHGIKPSKVHKLWSNVYFAPRIKVLSHGSTVFILRLAAVKVTVPQTSFSVLKDGECCYVAPNDDLNLPNLIEGEDDNTLVYDRVDTSSDYPTCTYEIADEDTTAAEYLAEREKMIAEEKTAAVPLVPANSSTVIRTRLVITKYDLKTRKCGKPKVLDFDDPVKTPGSSRANAWDASFDACLVCEHQLEHESQVGEIAITLISAFRPIGKEKKLSASFDSQYATRLRVDPDTLKVKLATRLSNSFNTAVWAPSCCSLYNGADEGMEDEGVALFVRESNSHQYIFGKFPDTFYKCCFDLRGKLSHDLFLNEFACDGAFDMCQAPTGELDAKRNIAFCWTSPEQPGDSSYMAHDEMAVFWVMAEQRKHVAKESAYFVLKGTSQVTRIAPVLGSKKLFYFAAMNNDGHKDNVLKRITLELTGGSGSNATYKYTMDDADFGSMAVTNFFARPDGKYLYSVRSMEGAEELTQMVGNAYAEAQSENSELDFQGSYGPFTSDLASDPSLATANSASCGSRYQILEAQWSDKHQSYFEFYPIADLDFAPDKLEFMGYTDAATDFLVTHVEDADKVKSDIYQVSIPRVLGMQLERVEATNMLVYAGQTCAVDVTVSNTGNVPLKGFTLKLTLASTGKTISEQVHTDLAKHELVDPENCKPVLDSSGNPTGEYQMTEDPRDKAGVIWPGKQRTFRFEYVIPDDQHEWVDLNLEISDPIADILEPGESEQASLQASNDASYQTLVDPRQHALRVTLGEEEGTVSADANARICSYAFSEEPTPSPSPSPNPNPGPGSSTNNGSQSSANGSNTTASTGDSTSLGGIVGAALLGATAAGITAYERRRAENEASKRQE